MTREEQIALFKKSVKEWNAWRDKNPNVEIDLSGIDLSNTDLLGINLRNSNLKGSNFNRSNLRNANFYKANLSKAFFQSSNLRNANLRSANLRSANLEESYLFKTRLQEAKLNGANLKGADLEASTLWAISYDADTNFTDVRNLEFALNVPQDILERFGERKVEVASEINLEKIQAELEEAKANLNRSTNQSREEKKLAKTKIQELQENANKLKQELDDLKKQQEKTETDINEAIKLFDKPNNYIWWEIWIANGLFLILLGLAVGSAYFFVGCFSDGLNTKFEILKNNPNIYLFLTTISPLVLAFSFAITMFKFANKKREEIKTLNEQKRKIETIKASLLAYNIVAKNPADVQVKIEEAILKLQHDAFNIPALRAGLSATDKKDDGGVSNIEKPIDVLNKVKRLVGGLG